MKKLIGLLAFLLLLYLLLMLADPGARTWYNQANLLKRIGLSGIVSLGAGILIISGGIDLSIGSVVALCATLFAMLLSDYGWSPAAAIPTVLALGAAIGAWHGVLVTRFKMQPFVVTLCGLFIYRGAARWLASEDVKGLGGRAETLRYWLFESRDVFGLPMFFVIFLVATALAAVLLHASVHGRYLYAIGSNELAARYAGIPTNRYKVAAYALCSLLAACYSILYLMENEAAQPAQTGTFLELHAIAGAVLGGCSLRGGEGSAVGILIGTTIMLILPNFTNMWGISSELRDTVIGGALLLGALLDESLRRWAAKNRT